MQIGMILGNGWRGDIPTGTAADAACESMLHRAERAVAAGVTSLWTYDHLEGVPSSRQAPCFEAWTTLAATAARIPNVTVGTLVSGILLREVGLLGKMAVTVDALSGGRLVVGLGAGWYRDELRHYGYAIPPFGERMERLEAAIGALESMWEGEPVHEAGLEGALCLPRPVQRPGPPIWLGGGSDRIVRLAAARAGGLNTGGSPTEVGEVFKRARARCEEVGRSASELTFSTEVQVLIDSTEETLARAVAGAGGDLTEFREMNLVGNAEHARRRAREYAEQGVDSLIAFVPDGHQSGTVERVATVLLEGAADGA